MLQLAACLQGVSASLQLQPACASTGADETVAAMLQQVCYCVPPCADDDCGCHAVTRVHLQRRGCHSEVACVYCPSLLQMMTVAAMLSPESSVFLGNKGPEQLAAGTEQQGGRGTTKPLAYAAGHAAYGRCSGIRGSHTTVGSRTVAVHSQLPNHALLTPNNALLTGLHDCSLLPPTAPSAGQQGGRGGGGGPSISEQGRELLKELQQEGLGDHILLLRLYEASLGAVQWTGQQLGRHQA